MEEKDTLILEKEVETVVEKQEKEVRQDKKIALDFAQTQKDHSVPKKIIKRVKNSSSAIDKPNYDFIEPLTQEQRQKVFKIEKAKPEKNVKMSKLRLSVFSILLVVFVGWGVGNLVNISNLNSKISSLNTLYELNLTQYLTKLGTLDSASGTADLFPTYPSDVNSPDSIDKASNWFDRICNFISRLFGG